MADVKDRGQIILITGLTIAVSLVVLTLLLNTVIFTQNLASRGTDVGAREAIEVRGAVDDTASLLIEEENERGHGNLGAIEENVTEGLDTYDTITSRRQGTDSEIVSVNSSSLTTVEGTIVRQTEDSRALTNESGAANWSLASDVPDTRAFTMRVQKSSLNETTVGDLGSDAPFHLNLTDGGTVWTVYVYRDSSTDDIAVATDDGTGAVERCTVDRDEATIDFSRGTLAGDECDGLDWPGPHTGSYDVAFRNGDNAIGTYDLTINTTGTVNTTNVNDGTTTDASPFFHTAIYSATLEFVYENSRLRYEAELRLAEGEP